MKLSHHNICEWRYGTGVGMKEESFRISTTKDILTLLIVGFQSMTLEFVRHYCFKIIGFLKVTDS